MGNLDFDIGIDAYKSILDTFQDNYNRQLTHKLRLEKPYCAVSCTQYPDGDHHLVLLSAGWFPACGSKLAILAAGMAVFKFTNKINTSTNKKALAVCCPCKFGPINEERKDTFEDTPLFRCLSFPTTYTQLLPP